MSAQSIARFEVDFISRTPPVDDRVDQLREWCVCFNEHGLTPKSSVTGFSLGNLSFRVDPEDSAFVITGSALNSKDTLTSADFVKVVKSDAKSNVVVAEGARDPSSESLMHYEIYKRRPDIGAIFHGHDKDITDGAARLNVGETEKEVLQGTAELVEQVMNVLENEDFLVMKNHGFVSLGKTMEEAGEQVLCIRDRMAEIRDQET